MKPTLLLTIFLTLAAGNIFTQTQLLINGNFSQTSGWSTTSNFYYNSNYTNCQVCPGYAYAASSTGQPKSNLLDYLTQAVNIPSTASSANVSFYTSATLSGSAVGTERLFVYIYDYTLSATNTITSVYFSATTSYQYYSFSVPSSCIGHSLELGFRAESTTTPTTIRVDEVSLTYVAPATCSGWAVTPNSANYTGSGVVGGNFTVSNTPGGCSYSPQSSVSWINGISYSGSTVSYNVDGNSCPSSSRTGNIYIYDANNVLQATFTITEAGLSPLTVTASANPNPACVNQNVTLTASGNGINYLWSGQFLNGTSGQSVSATPLNTGNYVYTVTAYANGCSTDATVTVAVNSPPSPPPVVSPSGTVNICNGQSATLTVTNPCSGCYFHWTQCPTCSLGSGNPFVAPNGGDWYCYEENSCGTSANSNTVVVNVVSIGIPITKTDATCGNNNGTATANPSGGTPPYTYLWSNGATTQTITGLSAGTYTCTVTDANGCTATASVTINSSSGVTASASSTDATCENSNGTATATSAGGTSPYSYLWSNGATTQIITGLALGTYIVTTTDANGCNDTANASISNTSIPTATTATTQDTGSCSGTATVNANGGTPPYSYNWSTTPPQTGQTAAGLCAGTYTVTITDAKNCTDTDTITITIKPNGINEREAEKHITVFPNPATNACTLSIDGLQNETVQIRVLNLQGAEILVSKKEKVKGRFAKEISLPNASKGIYFIQLNAGEKIYYRKLIIE